MRAIAFIRACIALVSVALRGATLPPLPAKTAGGIPTNLTNLKPWYYRATPPSYGVSYTNQLCQIPLDKTVSGYGRSNPRYVLHSYRHEPHIGTHTWVWAMKQGKEYVLELAIGDFELARKIPRNQEGAGTIVTNTHPSLIFQPFRQYRGWQGTNVITEAWPGITQLYSRVVEL